MGHIFSITGVLVDLRRANPMVAYRRGVQAAEKLQ
jgi:hypothetical protein